MFCFMSQDEEECLLPKVMVSLYKLTPKIQHTPRSA